MHLEVHTCDDTELAQAMATHVDATVLLLSQSTGRVLQGEEHFWRFLTCSTQCEGDEQLLKTNLQLF